MIEITMHFSKSTKNTHVYVDEKDGAEIPTLYIKKSALTANPPEYITINVEELKSGS